MIKPVDEPQGYSVFRNRFIADPTSIFEKKSYDQLPFPDLSLDCKVRAFSLFFHRKEKVKSIKKSSVYCKCNYPIKARTA